MIRHENITAERRIQLAPRFFSGRGQHGILRFGNPREILAKVHRNLGNPPTEEKALHSGHNGSVIGAMPPIQYKKPTIEELLLVWAASESEECLNVMVELPL